MKFKMGQEYKTKISTIQLILSKTGNSIIKQKKAPMGSGLFNLANPLAIS